MKSATVLVYGAGGHAKVIIDILEQTAFQVHCLLDDDTSLHGGTVCDYPVLGGQGKMMEMITDGKVDWAIVAIGVNTIRLRIAAMLEKAGFTLCSAIHPRATLGRDVVISPGTAVMAGAVINPGVSIGAHCIVNTGSIIEHDCWLGEGVHVAPGAVLCGNVTIGSGSLIGAGARIVPGITIGRNVIVGAGSTVLRDIPDNDVAAGSPARSIRKNANV